MTVTDMSSWRRLVTLLTVAVAMRVLVLGDPVIHVDEEYYFVVARAILHGALPYVDVWDRKPIGLFLLYLPMAALGLPWGIYAYQLLAMASAVATAWLIAALADRAGWRGGATAAAIAYLIWLDLLGGVGGQAPVFYNLIMAAAAWLVATRDRQRRARGVAAMALVGAALQIKYSVLAEGTFFGLWLLAAEWRTSRSVPALIGYGTTLVGVALLPTALAWGYYAAIGQGSAWLFADFGSILARRPDPWGERLGNAATLALLLSPIVAMTAAAVRDAAREERRPMRPFLLCWLAVALASVILFGGWFDHYGLPVLVPGAACTAAFLGSARGRRLAPAILAVAAGIGLTRVALDRAHRGNAEQLAVLAAAVGRGSGCLYVYSGTTMLYPATGRCTLSRYLFPSHLNRTREQGAIGVDQAGEIRRILAGQPAVIVMRPPYRGERPAVRAIVTDYVGRHYRLAATLPMGRETLAVYRR